MAHRWVCLFWAIVAGPDDAGLDTISESYRRAVERQGPGALVAYAAGILAFLLFVRWASGWLRKQAAEEEAEQRKIIAERERTVNELRTQGQRREWLRVPARLAVSQRIVGANGKAHFVTTETRDVAGGGVSFYSHHPPAPGSRLRFNLDIGERNPIQLDGKVVRVETPAGADEPALVAVNLAYTEPGDREHLVRWVTHEENRRIADKHKERLCPRCKRPLDDELALVHPKCK